MYIAIDVGGTKIKLVPFKELNPASKQSEIIIKTSGNFQKDTDKIVEKLAEYSTVEAVGVALPGFIVDKNVGVVSAANLPGWEGEDLKAKLISSLGINKVFLLHDGEAHAISETVWNVTEDDYIFIAWGTGIGATYIRRVTEKVYAQQIEFGFHYVDGRYIESLVGGNSFKRQFGVNPDKMNEAHWSEVVDNFATGIANLMALNYPKQVI